MVLFDLASFWFRDSAIVSKIQRGTMLPLHPGKSPRERWLLRQLSFQNTRYRQDPSVHYLSARTAPERLLEEEYVTMPGKQGYPITAKMCMTKDVGTHGNLFGGIMMSWMDESAAIFTREYTGESHVVTVRFSEIVFKHPVKVGQIVRFFATKPKLGKSSITFDISGIVDATTVVHTTCTFVALDEKGMPKQVSKSPQFE
ncbi:MAG: hotdog domain-containing protein [bacterium]